MTIDTKAVESALLDLLDGLQPWDIVALMGIPLERAEEIYLIGQKLRRENEPHG